MNNVEFFTHMVLQQLENLDNLWAYIKDTYNGQETSVKVELMQICKIKLILVLLQQRSPLASLTNFNHTNGKHDAEDTLQFHAAASGFDLDTMYQLHLAELDAEFSRIHDSLPLQRTGSYGSASSSEFTSPYQSATPKKYDVKPFDDFGSDGSHAHLDFYHSDDNYFETASLQSPGSSRRHQFAAANDFDQEQYHHWDVSQTHETVFPHSEAYENEHTHWSTRTEWTVRDATLRGLEVFQDPSLSQDRLPKEAGLIFMAKAPAWPQMLTSHGRPVVSHWGLQLKDIPWLPTIIQEDAPAWYISLCMTFGATIDDIAMRVRKYDTNPRNGQISSFTTLRNRFLKRADDWRDIHGGLGNNIKIPSSSRPGSTGHMRCVFAGTPVRNALTDQQLIYRSFWSIDAANGVMRQPGAAHNTQPLPLARELDGDALTIFLTLQREGWIPKHRYVPDLEIVQWLDTLNGHDTFAAQ